MKLGIGSYTYTWAVGVPGHMPAIPLTALELCERAEGLGVEVVQLCENVPVSLDALIDLSVFARQHSLVVEHGTRGLSNTALTTVFPRLISFETSFVRVVIDEGSDEPTPSEVVDRLQIWRRMLPGGIMIALENHDRFSAQTLVKIIEEAGPDKVGITLDTVNSFGALEGPEHVVRTLAPYVLSLHVKDFTIRRVPSQMGFVIEGCPAGEGRLDIPWLLDTIREAGRDPNAIIELWTPPADTLEETIAREADWAERSVKYMRSLLPD